MLTIPVSIAEFRSNIAFYLGEAQKGHTIVVQDKKKGRDIAELKSKKQYSSKEFFKVLKKVSGTFSAKDHPEWATKEKIVEWVNKSRAESERTFDDPPRF